MSSIDLRIANYFRNRLKSDPNVNNDGALRGWFEAARATGFLTVMRENIFVRSGGLYSELSGTIYEAHIKGLMTIFAFYEDDTLLWLDDHTNNSDYEAFIRREKLSQWLPDNMEKFVALTVETKFDFVGEPRLIHNASQIPPIPQKLRDQFARAGVEEDLIEREKRLAEVANQIKAPALTSASEGVQVLAFCIWARILGRVINIRCALGIEGTFSYEGHVLTGEVGNYVILR